MNARLKVAILERFRFQADFCQEAGISEDHLSRIIWGRREPSEKEIEKIVRTLQVKPEEVGLAVVVGAGKAEH